MDIQLVQTGGHHTDFLAGKTRMGGNARISPDERRAEHAYRRRRGPALGRYRQHGHTRVRISSQRQRPERTEQLQCLHFAQQPHHLFLPRPEQHHVGGFIKTGHCLCRYVRLEFQYRIYRSARGCQLAAPRPSGQSLDWIRRRRHHHEKRIGHRAPFLGQAAPAPLRHCHLAGHPPRRTADGRHLRQRHRQVQRLNLRSVLRRQSQS